CRGRALALPPLNTTLGRRTMEQTRIYQALKGVRGRASVDIGALEQLLVCFSQLVVEQRLIKEVDINPLFASPERLVARDARGILHPPSGTEADLPRRPIPPYPVPHEKRGQLKGGGRGARRAPPPEAKPQR